MSKPHFLYFISADVRAAVKIGITQDVQHRFAALQSGNHTTLALELALRLPDKRAAYLLEDALHQHFAEHWRHGEWFDFAPVLRDYVDTWNRQEPVEIPYPRLTCKQIIFDDQGTVMRKGDYLTVLRQRVRGGAK